MAVPLITDLTIGKYLKIVSKGAVYNNLSEDSMIWTKVKQKKAGPAEGRELRYNLRTSYGSAAADFLPVSGGSYPEGDKSSLEEAVAVYKDFGLTVEVERALINRAISDMSKYGEPLAEEMRAKTIALSRILSLSAYGDGTGVIGEISSVVVDANGDLEFTLLSTSAALGFVGWFEAKDKLVAYTKAGVEVQPDTATAYAHMQVYSKDRVNNKVTLRVINTSGAQVVQTTVANWASGQVFYRKSRKTNGYIINISTLGTTVDYNTVSEWWPGLESLTATDGRKVHGLNMTGWLRGQRIDAGGAAIDVQHFQKLMSQLMIATGQGRYKYKEPLMAWETYDALMESRETDRRFTVITDTNRGAAQLGYVHGKNTLIFTPDEFCPKQRIHVLPEGDVLQFYGRDFEFVNPNGSGQNFMLKPNGSGHDRVVRSYLEGEGSLICVHPQALGTIANFSV